MTFSVDGLRAYYQDGVESLSGLFEPFETLTKKFFEETPFAKWNDIPDEKKLSYIFQESLLLSAKGIVVTGTVYCAIQLIGVVKVAVISIIASSLMYKGFQNKEGIDKFAENCKKFWNGTCAVIRKALADSKIESTEILQEHPPANGQEGID